MSTVNWDEKPAKIMVGEVREVSANEQLKPIAGTGSPSWRRDGEWD